MISKKHWTVISRTMLRFRACHRREVTGKTILEFVEKMIPKKNGFVRCGAGADAGSIRFELVVHHGG